MCHGLQNNDSSKPSMEEVEAVKGDVEPIDQWVISCCHDKERNLDHLARYLQSLNSTYHVDHGQDTRSVSHLSCHSGE